MRIETERLQIIPLKIIQFQLLLEGIDRMEQELGLTPSGECFDRNTQEAMCEWTLNQPDVKSVIAETDADNRASNRVLEKCGMCKYEQFDESIRWRLDKQNRKK
jgi:hypothetical protein